MSVRWKWNRRGLAELQEGFSRGLGAIGDEVLGGAISRAPVWTGATRMGLHTDKDHSDEWPVAAVFVATASGDGFFVHEGTVDTPPHPFLSDALDAVSGNMPGIMKRQAKGKEFGIFRR